MATFERLNLKCLQMLFSSADEFWDSLATSDFDFIHAGIDAEALYSRDDFNRRYAHNPSTQEKKLIFYYTIRNYNHVAQNVLNHIMISLGDAYALLSEDNLHERVPLHEQLWKTGHGYRSAVSVAGFRIWSNFNYCIEKVVSFLDFTSKYVFELSNIKPRAVPEKLKARDVTFGDWKRAGLAKGTALTTVSEELRLLIALRDETVHKGTIDHFSRVYEHTVNEKVVRRFVLIPDHDKGKILTAAGRKRFFKQDNHLNVLLPDFLDKVFKDALASLNDVDSRIDNQWDDPESYFKRHKEYFKAMEAARGTGAFVIHIPSDNE